MSKVGYITVFSNQAATFNHPNDYNIRATVEAYKFEEVPDWVVTSRMFELLSKSRKIKVVEGRRSIAEIDNANGKIKNIEVSAALDSIEPEVTLAEDVSDSVDTSSDFTHMKSKELYEMCLERGIEVEAKQPKEYYIEKLS